MFALKFSRSPYLDNHLSEGIHTWTICTSCEAGFPFMPSHQRVHARGLGLQGPNLVHVQNAVFLGKRFLEVHTLTTTYQKAFILKGLALIP